MKLFPLRAIVLGSFLALITFTSQAQDAYRARLSPMPVTPSTVDTITGAGQVLFSLSGSTLTVSGVFKGMSSAATMIHIHNGPMAQPGPVVHSLEISKLPKGDIGGTVQLSDEQIQALKDNALYIQVHSESNPAGELRGWIFEQK